MNRVSFYKKISSVFLIIFIICTLLCIVSIGLLLHEDADYKNCTELAKGTLSSCVTQKKDNKTYYFGIYNFDYNNATWNYLNTDYYTDMNDVPETVLIKHNKFTNEDDMVATLKNSRSISIPIIYGVVALLGLMLFLMYHSQYRSAQLLEQSKRNVTDVNAELDETIH